MRKDYDVLCDALARQFETLMISKHFYGANVHDIKGANKVRPWH